MWTRSGKYLRKQTETSTPVVQIENEQQEQTQKTSRVRWKKIEDNVGEIITIT